MLFDNKAELAETFRILLVEFGLDSGEMYESETH